MKHDNIQVLEMRTFAYKGGRFRTCFVTEIADEQFKGIDPDAPGFWRTFKTAEVTEEVVKLNLRNQAFSVSDAKNIDNHPLLK